ncbi:MAG TPA: putative toxin-antitoxin system toxin component, PIN family [Ginsengibacter sp.]
MSNQKPKQLVIDTSVFINYTRHQKLYRLINTILNYDLSVYLSAELIDELERNIAIASAIELPQSVYSGYLENIIAACIIFEPVLQYKESPDAKDNFLFDLALQTNSEIIVTKETALLNFTNSPIPIHDIKWFKEMYPVPL